MNFKDIIDPTGLHRKAYKKAKSTTSKVYGAVKKRVKEVNEADKKRRQNGGPYYGPTGMPMPQSGPSGVNPKDNKNPRAKKPAKKTETPKQRESLDLKKLEGKGPSTVSSASTQKASLVGPTERKVTVDSKTKKNMEKDIKKTTRKANRAQKRYENTSSNKIAAKQRTKAQNLRESLDRQKEAYSHIAKKGGCLRSKKCK